MKIILFGWLMFGDFSQPDMPLFFNSSNTRFNYYFNPDLSMVNWLSYEKSTDEKDKIIL